MLQCSCLNGSTTLDIMETDQAPSPSLSLSKWVSLSDRKYSSEYSACVRVCGPVHTSRSRLRSLQEMTQNMTRRFNPVCPASPPSAVRATAVFTSTSCASIKISNISARKDFFFFFFFPWLTAVERWRNSWSWWGCIRDHPNTRKNIWNSWAEVL